MEDINQRETGKSATVGRNNKRRKAEESLLPPTKLKERSTSSSSELDDCTKMMDGIKNLLNKIERDNIKDVKNDILPLDKLRIRDIIKDLDLSLASGKLLFDDSKGEIDLTNVFCYKCPSRKQTTDNILILCKGGCKRGFHQSCMEPPMNLDDTSWTCYGCNCKARCFDLLQKYHKTKFSIADSWEKVFPEAEEYRLPSSDSKDDDDDDDEKKETCGNYTTRVEEELAEKTELNSSPKNNADGGSKVTTTKVNSASELVTITSTSNVDDQLNSEHVQSSEIRDFDLPFDVKMKYDALCCSLKMEPHDKVHEKVHKDLVRGMIVQIIDTVDQIKASNIAIASLDDLKIWKVILDSLATLGMDVGFLLARISNMIKLLSYYQANKNERKRLSNELQIHKQLHRKKENEIKVIEHSIDALENKNGDILSNELEVQKQLYRKKAKEIKVIEDSMDTLLGKFVDILPNNAKLSFEFSKDAKEGMGQFEN